SQAGRPGGRLTLFGKVENRKMLADDFLGFVSLDPLRARVPVGDASLGIEHIDRVVGDAVNQKPEVALAFEEVPLKLPAFFCHNTSCPTLLNASGWLWFRREAFSSVGQDVLWQKKA